MIDSKVILHDVFYDTSVNFLCTYLMLYTAGMCDVVYIRVYNTYLRSKYFLSAPYNDICLAPTRRFSLCGLVTQVHMLMPFLEAVHYAQTSVTLQQKYSVLRVCLCSEHTWHHHCFPLEGQCCECWAGTLLDLVFCITPELHFFLISGLGIMIYPYLPLFFQSYIYSRLCIFCSIRIVMNIQTQDPLLNLLSENHIML